MIARAFITMGITSDDIIQNTYGYGLFGGGLYWY